MRKLIIAFCLILFVLPCFAEYKPIPKNLSAQYKAEITKTIDKEYPKVVKEADKEFLQAQNIYNQCKLKTYKNDCFNDLDLQMVYIDNIESNFYMSLINKTDEFIKIKQNIPLTDFSGELYTFILPYLENNNIDLTSIDKLSKHLYKNTKNIENYIKRLSKN